MDKTKELIEMALTIKPAYAWCRELGIGKNAIAVSKHRGRLSPEIAGKLAKSIGLDEDLWIAKAVKEKYK